jgi:alkanesulfonate monooxygenase SsuD/methylene tetrahydromethanopterin reductase-like flavin-dependent oxidoreductase (luciferase family)
MSADRDTAAFAARAESLGYDSVWQGELWGWNVFVELAAAAERTDQVQLGTAIVNVFSRTPATIAMSAVSLARRSDDRAVLGLGTSTQTAVTNLQGLAFDRPVQRTHETVELVQAFLGNDGSVEYEGTVHESSGFPPLDQNVPIYNAALGPWNRRVTGRLCDGWLPNNVPFSELERMFEIVDDAAREDGRDPSEIDVAPWVHVAVDDQNPENARDLVRRTVAYYVGSGEGYRRAVATAFPEAAEVISERWNDGDRDGAIEFVTDDMVDDLGCAGTTAEVRDRLRRLVEETPVDHPIVDIPEWGDDALVERTLEAVAPRRW